ncbi:MAG: winged helix-turn-helix transcriptional regulator [Alphaproteobacteria bacterium]|nr:winged helix-turn-helix transcriptional regulator [Alphaproteobacteria bacterium]
MCSSQGRVRSSRTGATSSRSRTYPTRRKVLEQLRRGPRAVGQISARLPVSRPAVSQHLKVLKEAGLVREERRGTQHIYEIDPNGFGPLRAWLDQLWDTALESFKAEVEAPPKKGKQT